jgi:hypothetical protein
VKDENGDLHADSHNILNRWNNYFSQLLNIEVHRVSDVRRIQLILVILRLKLLLQSWKGINHQVVIKFQQNWLNMEGNMKSEIYKLFLLQVWKNCLINKRSILLHQFTRMEMKPIVVIIVEYHCHKLHTKMLSSILLSLLSPYIDEVIGYHQCGFWHNRLLITTDKIFAVEKKWV